MIERQISAEKINLIANDPSVYPWIAGPFEGELDFTETIAGDRVIALFGEYGGFIFYRIAEGIYDAHSAVLPAGRGKWAVRTAREALAWMFDKEDAQEVMMAVPHGNVAVRALVRILKANFRGTIEDGWWREGHPINSDIYSLTKSDWEQCQQH